MRWVMLWILVAVGWMGGVVLGQPEVTGVFTNLSLEEAFEESKRTHRVLIVYPRSEKGPYLLMEEMTWKNPTLAAWIRWHGIAVRLDAQEQREEHARFMRAVGSRRAVGGTPTVYFFVRGRLAGMYPDPVWHGFVNENPLGLMGGRSNVGVYPTAVQVLLHLDLLMDRMRAKEAVWFEQHEQHNPMPDAPPVPLLHAADDGDAPPVHDPEAASGEDVLTRLKLAREHAALREHYDATGVYTWLYERGAEVEPSFRAFRSTFMVAEMADLARRRDGSQKRFLKLKENLEARWMWWTYSEMLDWMRLIEAMGMADQTLNFFIMFTVDEQEATMIPPADRGGYRLLASRTPMTDPGRVRPEELEDLKRRAVGVNSRARPRGVEEKEWAGVIDLRKRMFEDDACRLHAAFLLRGDPGRAAEAAKLFLGVKDDGEARLALVMTAVAAGAERTGDHERWVAEARARGVVSATLEREFGEK